MAKCSNCKGQGWTVELRNGMGVSVQRCTNCKQFATTGTARAAFVTQVNDAFDILRSAIHQWPQAGTDKEINGGDAVDWLVPFLDSVKDVVGYDEDVVNCKLCGEPTRLGTAHRHDGGYVGEECWDERLRSTE